LAAPGFAAEADLAGAADLEVAALEAADFAVDALEATGFDADFVAVDLAPVFGVAGFDAVVVPVFLEAVAAGFPAAGLPAAMPVAFFCDAAGLAAVLVPARLAAGLVGALVAAAIGMFLLANDCGLVSAWRLTRFRLGHRKSAPA
jgi:hypothetical protein